MKSLNTNPTKRIKGSWGENRAYSESGEEKVQNDPETFLLKSKGMLKE